MPPFHDLAPKCPTPCVVLFVTLGHVLNHAAISGEVTFWFNSAFHVFPGRCFLGSQHSIHFGGQKAHSLHALHVSVFVCFVFICHARRVSVCSTHFQISWEFTIPDFMGMSVTCRKIRSSNIASVFLQWQDKLALFFYYPFLQDIQRAG